MRVKLFASTNLISLEDKINTWLEENQFVIDTIQYQHAGEIKSVLITYDPKVMA